VQDDGMPTKARCLECRCSFRPCRAGQRLCGRVECRRAHHNQLARARRKEDLAQSRADERRRQAKHRAGGCGGTGTGRDTVRMSRTRSEAEVIEMVGEIEKKLAGVKRWATQVSRTGSTPQAANRTAETSDFRG
jgi:hypothetical protein